MAIDPSAEQLLHLSSEVLTAQARCRRQQRVIWCLVACLRASQRAQAELVTLMDELLAGDDG